MPFLKKKRTIFEFLGTEMVKAVEILPRNHPGSVDPAESLGADDVKTTPSAASVLTWFLRNILNSAPNGLTHGSFQI